MVGYINDPLDWDGDGLDDTKDPGSQAIPKTDPQEKIFHKQLISKDLDIPVFLPIDEGLDGILEILESKFYENWKYRDWYY